MLLKKTFKKKEESFLEEEKYSASSRQSQT